jgi:hypothetical protein
MQKTAGLLRRYGLVQDDVKVEDLTGGAGS